VAASSLIPCAKEAHERWRAQEWTHVIPASSITELAAAFAPAALAVTEDMGNGFLHHGVATPVSNHRGTVATVDGEGRDVVLVWLFDHRGGYALLMIDAATGNSEEFPVPFPPGGDCRMRRFFRRRTSSTRISTATSRV